MTSASLPVYLINIDRAAERLAVLLQDAARFGIDIERVAGIDGTLLAPAERVNVDEALFFRRNGRTMLAGEYGCYRSHMVAYERLLDNGVDAAVIIEDDVGFDATFRSRVEAIYRAMPDADVIKLVNHRTSGFFAVAETDQGDRIGRCFIGPQGSGACYLVTRAGAQKLLQALKIMSLPADMALERGWASGVEIFTVEHNVLPFGSMREATMIGTRADYRAVKQPQLQRMPAHLFRVGEFFARLAYAARGIAARLGRRKQRAAS